TANKSLLALEANAQDEESLKLLQRSLQTLKGDANSVGFGEIGTLAHRLEDLLAIFSNTNPDLNPEVLDLLLFGIDTLGDLVHRKGQWLHTPIDTSQALGRIESFIGRHKEGKKSVSRSSPMVIELNEYQELQIRQAHAEGKKALQMIVRFSDDCSMHAAGAFIIYRQLQFLGEVVTSFPSIDDDDLLEESN